MDARFFIPGAIAPVPPPRQDAAAAAVPPVADAAQPLHDPPLAPRDEAVFLLTAAAEVEHALMVQYLYAAYSVQADDAPRQELRDVLLQIAREEMGHLATVQNLLHVVGGPLNLARDPAPSIGGIYPFRFTLEPLTLKSLAKYVVAESPSPLPADFPDEDVVLLEQIRAAATAGNGGEPVRHVGRIFERLGFLFAGELTAADVRTDTAGKHATFADWGFLPRNTATGEPLIVDDIVGADAAAVRAAAATAVNAIGAQGEGFDPGPVGSESHFERFLALYKSVAALIAAGVTVARPVATDPNTSWAPTAPVLEGMDAVVETQLGPGRITHPRTRAWAHLFNLRYRMLLAQLAHFLSVDGPSYTADGDRTHRGLLLIGTFDEMRHLSKIAGKLVELPKDDPPGAVNAGPPFELPYTLNLPDGEPQRWRMHLDASRAAARLVQDALPTGDPFLVDMMAKDVAAQAVMEALATGLPVPGGALPADFAKAVTILEEAVRGFTIGRHGNLWAGTTRDEFLALKFFGQNPVALNPDGTVDPVPDDAPLIGRLTATDTRARMPRYRPPVPPERVEYLKKWITDGAPDGSTPGRVGVRHERDPGPTERVEVFAQWIAGGKLP